MGIGEINILLYSTLFVHSNLVAFTLHIVQFLGGEGDSFVPLLPIFMVRADNHSNFLWLDCV
jgi:hypothetical protein